MDDFGPAKNLMTMCFTYYHIGEPLERDSEELRLGNRALVHRRRVSSWLQARVLESTRSWCQGGVSK